MRPSRVSPWNRMYTRLQPIRVWATAGLRPRYHTTRDAATARRGSQEIRAQALRASRFIVFGITAESHTRRDAATAEGQPAAS